MSGDQNKPAEGVREKPIPYAVNFNFFASVVTEEPPRVSSSGREIVFCFKKVNHAFWPRLLSETVKCSWLKIDFNRWKDEDDEDSEPEMGGGLPNMLSQMSNFKDYGNEELMDDVDSDDEDLPDLDPPTAGETHDEKTEITA